MTIDDAKAIRLLEKLPRDLTRRGWTLDRRDTSVQRHPGSRWHDAVYTRPFDHETDAEALRHIEQGRLVVRISTIRIRCDSWQAAHDEAIELMREVDAQR